MNKITKLSIAAVLLSSVSTGAMAATITGPNTNAGTIVASEQFGTGSLGDALGSAPLTGPAAQAITITPSVTGGFTQAQMILQITMTGGTWSSALSNSNLVCSTAGSGTNINLSSGGAKGTSTVTYLVDTAQMCASLVLYNPQIQGVNASGVSFTATLTSSASNLPVDNGVSGTAVYATLKAGATASAGTATSDSVNLAGGGTTLTAASVAGTSNRTLLAAPLTLTVPANSAKLATGTLGGTYSLPTTATGTITISGLPAAATGVVLASTNPTSSALIDAAAAASNTSCSAPVGMSTTCTIAAPVATNWTTLYPVIQLNGGAAGNGTAVINSATVTASASLAIGGTNVASESLFTGSTIANIGNNACAADFGSIIGKNNSGYTSTIRVTNTTANPAKVYAAISSDAGVQTQVIQLTQANTGATNGLNSSNLLPAGGSLEVLGASFETMAQPTIQSFVTALGTSRARVRMYVEASGSSTQGSLAGKGCTAEGWICSGSSGATCTQVTQLQSGTDGVTETGFNK